MDTMPHLLQPDTAQPVPLVPAQQALVAIQALERERLSQDGEERKHPHNPTSQKFKDNI